MIDEKTIRKAAEVLLTAAPGSKVFLFGSYARGTAGPDSDLDFLVVEPQVADRMGEMVRLRGLLDPLLGPRLVPVDVLVYSRDEFLFWRETPNTVIHEAATRGRVYEQVA